MTLTFADEARLSASGPGLEQSIAAAMRALLDCRQGDGHWVFELEADATIPSEYVLLRHYRGEPIDAILEQKIARYLRRIQGAHGGWGLYHQGDFDMSASVKAYFALKMIGDPPDASHMARARDAILARGGAVHCNVFTRVLLSLYGVIRWRSVPEMPVEILLLPRWFPFHLSKVSYWARTVMVPLLVLQALRPRAKNPLGVTIDELFIEPPQSVGPAAKAAHQSWIWFGLFRGIDAVLRPAVKVVPKRLRQRAIARAVAFVTERLNGDDGLGAIFPAMANSVMMFDVLGDEANAAIARASVEKLLVVGKRRSLLPALRFACVGYGPGLPRALGNRRRRSSTRPPVKGWIGCCRARCSIPSATGRRGVRRCGRAGGLSNMPIRTIPISTTPPSS